MISDWLKNKANTNDAKGYAKIAAKSAQIASNIETKSKTFKNSDAILIANSAKTLAKFNANINLTIAKEFNKEQPNRKKIKELIGKKVDKNQDASKKLKDFDKIKRQ